MRASQSRRSHASSSRHESDKEKMKLRLRSSKSKSSRAGSERGSQSRSRRKTVTSSSGKKRTSRASKTASKHENTAKAVAGETSSEENRNEPMGKAEYSEQSVGAFPMTPNLSSTSLSLRRRSTLTPGKAPVLGYMSSDNDEASGLYERHPAPINVFQFQSDWSEDEEDLNSPTKEERHNDLPAQYESATDSHVDDHAQYESAADSHVDEAVQYEPAADGHGDEGHHDMKHEDAMHAEANGREEAPVENYWSESGRSEMADTLPMDIHPRHTYLSHPLPDNDFAIDDNPTPMPGHFLNSTMFPLTNSLTQSTASSSPPSSSSNGNSDANSVSQASTAPTDLSTSPESFKSASAELPPTKRSEEPSEEPVQEHQDTSAAKLEAQMAAAQTHRRNSNKSRRRPSLRERPQTARRLSSAQVAVPPQQQQLYAEQQYAYPPFGAPPPNQAQGYYPAPAASPYPPPPMPQEGIAFMPPIPLQIAEQPHVRYSSPSSPERQHFALQHHTPVPPSLPAKRQHRRPDKPVGEGGVHKYRTFTTLQHRLLSSLQAEIEAAEAQLDALDAQVDGMDAHVSQLGSGALAQRKGELMWRRSQLVEHVAGKLGVYYNVRDDMEKRSQHRKGEMGSAGEEDVPEQVKKQLEMIEEMTRKVEEKQKELCMITGQGEQEISFMSPLQTVEEREKAQRSMAAVIAAVLLPLMTFPFIHNFGGRIVVAALVGIFCYANDALSTADVRDDKGTREGDADVKHEHDGEKVEKMERGKRRRMSRESSAPGVKPKVRRWEQYSALIGAGVWGATILVMAGAVR